MKIDIPRVTAVTMEPRAALGHYDAETGRYTVYAGSGGAVRQKAEIATVLGVAQEKVRVLSFDVGGNFGARNRCYVEFGLVAWASRKVGRPVKYTATRSEAFLSDYQGRDLATTVELALTKDGRFLAIARGQRVERRRARGVAVAARQGRGPHHRLLRHSRRDPARARGIHPHDADQRLSQLGPAGGEFRDRAADRQGGARAWLRSCRVAAQELRRRGASSPT